MLLCFMRTDMSTYVAFSAVFGLAISCVYPMMAPTSSVSVFVCRIKLPSIRTLVVSRCGRRSDVPKPTAADGISSNLEL
eukprot:7334888-Prymnesium_polylepis.1